MEAAMSHANFSQGRKPGVFWEILLALALGAAIFIVLIPLTGGTFAYLVPIAVAMVLFGLVHYLFWGRASLYSVAVREREASMRAAAAPPDEFELVLNEKERADLMAILEQSLNSRVESEQSSEKGRLRGILERLRGFGA
jgi:hypothetical protein